jgi:hypothetical protein
MIRMRLGGSNDPLEPFPQKPRGMHWRTYRRLRDQAHADRQLPTQHLAALVERAVPVLRHLEKVIHPRWPTPIDATKRVVGTVVVTLNATLLFTPIPLSNVVPALAIALISLAYLEEDGLLLSIALLAAVIVLAIQLAAVWETIRGAEWIVRLW